MEQPVLTIDNLVLRPITEKDIAAVFNLFSNDAVTRYMDIPPMSNISEAQQLVSFFRERLEQEEGMRWGIAFRDHPGLIGTCGYHHWKKTHYKAEIGYDLLPDYWGKGIMTHAVYRMLQFGFEAMNLNRIEAFVDPANHASSNLLQRVGFTREGLLRDAFFEKDEFVDAYIFSLLKRELPQHPLG